MRKKLFTLQELYDYIKTGRSFQYSAKDEKEELHVVVDSVMTFTKKNEDDIEGLLPVELWSCHLGENLNGSSISKEAAKKAFPSFANRPILGYIHEVDGQPEFYGHNMHEEGEELVYDEVPVGVIPESNGIHFDEKDGRTYIVVNGYLYEDYSKAAEILEREESCSCSVELSVREFSYDAKSKVLVFDDFFFSGVTILGKNDEGKEVKPGMVGSTISLFQSDSETNSLIETLEKLNETLSRFNINNQTGKEETSVTLFEQLLEQYGKTVEDITFDYEGLSDDELREAFEKAFSSVPVEEEAATEEETQTTITDTECIEDEEDETVPEGEAESLEEVKPEEEETVTVTESIETETYIEPMGEPETVVASTVEFAATIGDKVRTFSVSLNDKLAAIYELVNAAYGELDDDWYDVVAYEDTKTLEMHGMFRGKNYRQNYKVRNNEYQLVGDRVEIFCKWMTEDEINQFENMKSNYAALEQYKADKELEIARNEKMSLLDKYSSIAETEEYKALVQNIDTYSNDEVVEKANAIVGKFAMQGKTFDFSAVETPATSKHFFGFTNKDNSNKKDAPAYAGFLN